MSNLTPIGRAKLRHRLASPAKNPFAIVIDELCIQHNTSQWKLAILADINHTMLSRLRSGERGATPATIEGMLHGWPLTEAQRVTICEHFQYVPAGYRIVPVNREVPMG